MTFVDYLSEADKYWRLNRLQRKGQAYFNFLCDVRPEISNRINGTLWDPFFDDDRLGLFLAKVGELWNE